MFFILYLVPFFCLSLYSSYYPCTFYSKLCPSCISSNKCSLHSRLFSPDFMSSQYIFTQWCVSLSFSTNSHVIPQQGVHGGTCCGMTWNLAPDGRVTWTLGLVVRGWYEIWFQIREGCNELLGLVVRGWHEILNEKLRDDMNCGPTCCANKL
jgi:hypothetical protein